MINLINLNKTYKKKGIQKHVLKDLNLSLEDKGIVFITGKSQSGKTTLLNLIGGLDYITSGDILINNISLSNSHKTDLDRLRANQISIILEDDNLDVDSKVEDNINIATKIHDIDYKSNINKYLSPISFEGLKDVKISSLSNLQKRYVSVARALSKNPNIILCDNPFKDLNNEDTTSLLDLLRKSSEERLVVVFTEKVDFSFSYSDRVVMLEDGYIIDNGSYDESLILKTDTPTDMKSISFDNYDVEESVTTIVDELSNNTSLTVNFINDDVNSLNEVPTNNQNNTKSLLSTILRTFKISLNFLFAKKLRLLLLTISTIIAITISTMLVSFAQFDNVGNTTELLNKSEFPIVDIYCYTTHRSYSNSHCTKGQFQILIRDSGFLGDDNLTFNYSYISDDTASIRDSITLTTMSSNLDSLDYFNLISGSESLLTDTDIYITDYISHMLYPNLTLSQVLGTQLDTYTIKGIVITNYEEYYDDTHYEALSYKEHILNKIITVHDAHDVYNSNNGVILHPSQYPDLITYLNNADAEMYVMLDEAYDLYDTYNWFSNSGYIIVLVVTLLCCISIACLIYYYYLKRILSTKADNFKLLKNLGYSNKQISLPLIILVTIQSIITIIVSLILVNLFTDIFNTSYNSDLMNPLTNPHPTSVVTYLFLIYYTLIIGALSLISPIKSIKKEL